MRTERDLKTSKGELVTGFDYDLQVWVVGGIIQRCGHPEWMDCGCLGRRYAGTPLAVARLDHESARASR